MRPAGGAPEAGHQLRQRKADESGSLVPLCCVGASPVLCLFSLDSVLINGETLISQILVAEENVVHYQAAQTLPGSL